MGENIEIDNLSISDLQVWTDYIETLSPTNKIRIPRLHEFDYSDQRLVTYQKDAEVTECSEIGRKCRIHTAEESTIDANDDDDYLCTNSHLDILANSAVSDALTHVSCDELFVSKGSHQVNGRVETASKMPMIIVDKLSLGDVRHNINDSTMTNDSSNFSNCTMNFEREEEKNVSTISVPVVPLASVEVFDDRNACCSSAGAESITEGVTVYFGKTLQDMYRKELNIGSGKFAKVYKVVHLTQGTIAAAKEIPYRSEGAKERIVNEIDILKYLSGNEYIVKLHSVLDSCFTRPRRMILILEYLGGGELFEQITNDLLLTEEGVIRIMIQILEGVTYIHSKGIIHRDLKPENIVYRSKSVDKIKIIDFGLAIRYDAKKPPKSMVGTTIFVAPEVLRYENQSYKTDIWSIGVIAYNLLSGITPFEIPTSGDLDRRLEDSEIIENIERCAYNYDDAGFDGVSDEAKSFISSILIKDPQKRMTGLQCLKHEWLTTTSDSDNVSFNRTLSIKRMQKYMAIKNWGKVAIALKSVNYFKAAISDACKDTP